MSAIKMLRGAGVRAYLSPTFSKYNFHELPDLFNLARSLGADFSCKVMIPMGRAENLGKYCLDPKEQKELFEYLSAKRSELQGNMKITTTCNPYSAFLENPGILPPDDGRIRGGCSGGISQLCIGSYGNVTPCSRLQVSVGNVRDSSLEEIWYSSEVLDNLRDRSKLKGKCGRCEYKNWCGGCRAMAIAWCGDYLAEDPDCWLNGTFKRIL